MKIQASVGYNLNSKKNFGNLSKSMMDIFASSEVSQPAKKILWDLSEKPYFCSAAQATPKKDLLTIVDMLKQATTNIPRMFINGDIKLVHRSDKTITQDLFSLKAIAKYNDKAPQNKKKNLLEIIRTAQLPKIEQDIKESYQETYSYPQQLFYKESDKLTEQQIIADTPLKKKMLQIISQTPAQAEGETSVLFKHPIKGKNDVQFQYYPTPKEIIEKPITRRPEIIAAIYKHPDVPLESKKALYDLEKIPYFNNLVKDSNINTICTLAKLDCEVDNIFKKMLSKKIVFQVVNQNGSVIDVPIIDPKRLLADQKFGIIKEKDIIEVLEKRTPAIEILRHYIGLKTVCKDQEVSRMVFRSREKGLLIEHYTQDGDSFSFWNGSFSENPENPTPLKKFLDKLPYKSVCINF